MATTKTATDLTFELADQIHECGEAIREWLWENWDDVPDQEADALISTEQLLFAEASEIRLKGVGAILTEAGADVDTLVKATEEARKTIVNIKVAKQLVNVATATLVLAAAITTGNVSTIAGATGGLVVALQGVAKAADKG